MFQKVFLKLTRARRFRSGMIALCAIGAIVLVAVGASPLLALGTVNMRVDPVTRAVPVNGTFTVDIVADVSTEMDPNRLGAYGFNLVYDSDYLEVSDVSDAGELSGPNSRVVPVPPAGEAPPAPIIDNPNGQTAFAAYSYPPGAENVAGPDGTVVLATVTLQAKQAGVTTLNLENGLLTDTQANAWPDGGTRQLNIQGSTIIVKTPRDQFDGDGQSDAGLYRDGLWFIKRSSDGGMTAIVHGGMAQDVPLVGDFDGDGKSDAVVYRDGVWFAKRSSDGGMTVIVHGGLAQDVPLVGDFDGDGTSDAVVYRDGVWFAKRSSDGGMTIIVHGGLAQDVPLIGDFDGDARSDATQYRDGVWFVKRSSDGGMTVITHGGLAQDMQLVGDFDGDGESDAGVYRDGFWFIKRSSDGGLTVIVHGGLPQDAPLNGRF